MDGLVWLYSVPIIVSPSSSRTYSKSKQQCFVVVFYRIIHSINYLYEYSSTVFIRQSLNCTNKKQQYSRKYYYLIPPSSRCARQLVARERLLLLLLLLSLIGRKNMITFYEWLSDNNNWVKVSLIINRQLYNNTSSVLLQYIRSKQYWHHNKLNQIFLCGVFLVHFDRTKCKTSYHNARIALLSSIAVTHLRLVL